MTFNRQQAFDTMVRGLFQQGKVSMDDNRCLYRGPDGAKCAIGFLIPDQDYRPSFEGPSVWGQFTGSMTVLPEISQYMIDKQHCTKDDMRFLAACQRQLHDDLRCRIVTYVDNMLVAASDIARQYQLNNNVVNQLKGQTDVV